MLSLGWTFISRSNPAARLAFSGDSAFVALRSLSRGAVNQADEPGETSNAFRPFVADLSLEKEKVAAQRAKTATIVFDGLGEDGRGETYEVTLRPDGTFPKILPIITAGDWLQDGPVAIDVMPHQAAQTTHIYGVEERQRACMRARHLAINAKKLYDLNPKKSPIPDQPPYGASLSRFKDLSVERLMEIFQDQNPTHVVMQTSSSARMYFSQRSGLVTALELSGGERVHKIAVLPSLQAYLLSLFDERLLTPMASLSLWSPQPTVREVEELLRNVGCPPAVDIDMVRLQAGNHCCRLRYSTREELVKACELSGSAAVKYRTIEPFWWQGAAR